MKIFFRGKAGALVLIFMGALSYGLTGTHARQSRGDWFQFVRVHFKSDVRSQGPEHHIDSLVPPPWAHDYPKAEENLLRALSESALIETSVRSHAVLDLDDPAILHHPILYMSEPGTWRITQEEVSILRRFLDGGGFLILDDFRGQEEWDNLSSALGRVQPAWSFRRLTVTEAIFQAPFRIDTLDLPPPYRLPGKPAYFGLVSPDGSLHGVACFNMDLGDYWERDDETREVKVALRLGINLVVYALNH